MSGFLTSAIAFIVAIGILVAVHEYGHFWVARRLGIRVLRFSIGFGRPIWSRVGRDGVEYVVSALPLGGYVKLLDEREGPVPEDQVDQAFNRQSPWRRIAVLVAGPLFNFLFAIVAYWAMFAVGVPAVRAVLGDPAPESAAAEAGIRSGDRITAVDGEPVETMTDAYLMILEAVVAQGRVSLQLEDGSGVRESTLVVPPDAGDLTEPGALFPGLGLNAWEPKIPPMLGEVMAGGTAASSGLRGGDLILAADGQRMEDWPSWVAYVRARPGQIVPVEIQRDGQRLLLDLSIGMAEGPEGAQGVIGASVDVPEGLYDHVATEQRYGPLAALSEAAGRTAEMSALTVRMLWRMVAGDVSLSNLSGPINIAQTAGATASAGMPVFLSFLAIVSISLGILNLLPIPMLDGGQIVYQVVELAKGSPVSERVQIIGQQVGILLLLALMSFAFYNDIARLGG
jgi:regulator of sigma E protease